MEAVGLPNFQRNKTGIGQSLFFPFPQSGETKTNKQNKSKDFHFTQVHIRARENKQKRN